MTKFHFISGLLGSGSTLLVDILRQKPRFHAVMSSPVAGLTHSESYAFFVETKRKAICKAISGL
jgi:sulfotransferase